MPGPYIVYGEFKGLFKTRQHSPMGSFDDFPTDNQHAVQVYQGDFLVSESFTEFKPHDYRKLKSFVLLNVPNIGVQSKNNDPFSGKQTFMFTELILIDPKIVKTYEINHETYGQVASMAYGKTYSAPQLQKFKPDPFNDTGYSDHQQWYRSQNGCWNNGINGCGNLYQGCLANIWRILGLILLLLMLFGVFRACQAITNDRQACIDAELAKKRRVAMENEIKRTKAQYDANLKSALANVSTIYFYRNSADLHANSTGLNGTIDRLTEIITAYEDKQFILEGHHAGNSIEKEGIDLQRAQKVKYLLTQKGIKEHRITVLGRKDTYASPMPIYKFIEENGIREYNQNMKVTVRVKQEPQ